MYENLRIQAEMRGIKHHAVGAGVFNEQGKLLVLERKADDSFAYMYEIPGGGVEPGETLMEALRRELKEETNLDLQSLLSYCGSFDYVEIAPTRQYNFMVKSTPGEIRLTEHQNYRWIGAEEDIQATPEMRESIRRLFARQNIERGMTPAEREKLELMKAYAKDKLAGDYSGHDYSHACRVASMAGQICREEGGNLFVILAAAYLHDVIDDKVVIDPVGALSELLAFLKDTGVEEQESAAIRQIITGISFRQSLTKDRKIQSLEAKIVQDADRLDAIGAIGIGRVFYYGGNRSEVMYDPQIPVRVGMTPELYRQPGTTINHFYEKLLLLMDKMHTETARNLAKKRQMFMLDFLDRFYDEWTV